MATDISNFFRGGSAQGQVEPAQYYRSVVGKGDERGPSDRKGQGGGRNHLR